MRKLTLAAAAATLLLLGVSTAAQAATLPTAAISALGGPFKVKPAGFTLSADGAFFIAGTGPRYGRITWNYWNAKFAGGTGVAWQNNCTPSCATGTYQGFRVRLWLWHPVLLNGGEAFTRMKVKYSHNVPKNATHPKRVTYWRYRNGWGLVI